MTTRQVQSLLLYLGYPVGAPDGITGSQTRQAVMLFQTAEGLKADGDPGQETQTALLAAVAAGRMYTLLPRWKTPRQGRSGTKSGTSGGQSSAVNAVANIATDSPQKWPRKPCGWRTKSAAGLVCP